MSGVREFFLYERNFDKAAQGIFDEIIFHVDNLNNLTIILNRIFEPIINLNDESYLKANAVYSQVWKMLLARLEVSFRWTQKEEPVLEPRKLPLLGDLKAIY